MAFVHNLYSASGLSSEDCCSLGQRYDDGVPFSVYRCESMVIRYLSDSRGDSVMGAPVVRNRHFTMLWRSAEHIVYVTDPQEGIMRAHQDAQPDSWVPRDLGASLRGVWGLDDQNVFAWGVSDNDEPVMFRWDGRDWKNMPSPGPVAKMHGLSGKDLLAVGQNGLLAHWDGKGWTEIPVDTNETLGGVFMVNANEYYVVGQQGGFFEGSAAGCRKKLTWEAGSLADVAKFLGEVWVAAPFQGLLKLVPKKAELELIKPNLKPTSLEARGELLVSCPDRTSSSKDGKAFFSAGVGYIESIRKDKKPLWKD